MSCRLHGAEVPERSEVLEICGPMKQTQEELMHAWQKSQKQEGEIGISGSRVDRIRSLPPAHTPKIRGYFVVGAEHGQSKMDNKSMQ